MTATSASPAPTPLPGGDRRETVDWNRLWQATPPSSQGRRRLSRRCRAVMALVEQVEMTKQELDAIAWRFLGSEFTAQSYANWPIDRRVDAYLLHHGLVEFVNDGAA